MDIRNWFKSEIIPKENTSNIKNNITLDFFIKKDKVDICLDNKKDTSNINISNNSDKVFKVNKNNIYVFTDGSTINNGKKNSKGGIGIYFSQYENLNHKESSKDNKITNNTCEIKACIKAIEILITNNLVNKQIFLYTDSEYTKKSITIWCKSWEKNGWLNKKKQPIKNKLLIQTLYNYYKLYKIQFIHVRSHTQEPKDKKSKEYFEWYGNMMADKLAKSSYQFST